MNKLRIVNQIKPKHSKWNPEMTGTIDRDKYNGTVIGLYDHEPLHAGRLTSADEQMRSEIDAGQ